MGTDTDIGRVTSPLRWAGSKRTLLPRLLELMPINYRRYIEPFAGSACLFFASDPRRALLADFNEALMNTYRAIQQDDSGVADQLQILDPYGRDYYGVRDAFNRRPGRTQAAAYFLYLNRFGFNGVYRTNRAGEYNVPRGSRTGSMISAAELTRLAKRLADVELRTCDFRETMRRSESGDFLYVDPPYVATHRATYGEYGYGSFAGTSDLEDMASELTLATERGVKVLLSFGSSAPFAHLLSDWNVVELATKRKISSKLSTRSAYHGEIIAMNYRTLG